MKAAECGIWPEQFWRMTWKDFMIILLGEERKQLAEWSRVRSIAYMLYVVNTTEKTPKSIERFWPMPLDDKEDVGEPMTTEQLQRTIKLYQSLK